MAERKSKQYKLNELSIEIQPEIDPNEKIDAKARQKGERVFDMAAIVASFKYVESIESPFLRCDITVVDATDFNKMLRGGETVSINLVTDSSKDSPLNIKLRVYKIGSVIKRERAQMFVLHCVSPEAYNNELNKVFNAFGPGEGSKNVDNIPRHIVKKYLKADNKKAREKNFEAHSKLSFISPNWRPTDCIAYIGDKVTRQNGKGNVSTAQSGYMFFENKDGFQFRSIDGMCEGALMEDRDKFKYTYTQQGVEGTSGFYNIETVQFPDKANHIEKMRYGAYKSLAIGISIPKPTDSSMTQTGATSDKKSSPAGTISGPREMKFGDLFKRASTLEKEPPYKVGKMMEASPTRNKIRIVPAFKNQAGLGDANNGTTTHIDTLNVAEYAAARYNLLKAIKLEVEVPGNTGLGAGHIIQVAIPAAKQEGKTVKEDLIYSGHYLIASLQHIYRKEGITTKMTLLRDSIKKQNY